MNVLCQTEWINRGTFCVDFSDLYAIFQNYFLSFEQKELFILTIAIDQIIKMTTCDSEKEYYFSLVYHE